MQNGRLFIYIAVIAGALAIAIDFASVDLALPDLERQFGFDLNSVQWVVNGYVLAFSVLMVAGGKMADGYGRKKVFVLGMAIFALASLLGGLAWSGASLIAFRIFQGVGAALLWPAMIGMACEAVGEKNRGTALGLIFGSCSLGNAAGPVIGGALTEFFSWRWVLWVNVPLAIIPIVITLWKVPKEPSQPTRPTNDWIGMGILTGGLVALMVLIYQGPVWGWESWQVVSLGFAAVILLGSFPFVERWVKEPIVPLDLMRNKELLTLCFCAMTICQLFFIVLLYFTQYAMKFLGDDPLSAGMRVVQFMLTYGLVSYFAGPLYQRFGARKLLLFGVACDGVASVLLAMFGPGAGPIAFNGSLILLGIGVGCTIPNISSRAIETVGVAKASLVSGLTFMCQLSGAALLMAVGTAIFGEGVKTRLIKMLSEQGLSTQSPAFKTIEDVLIGSSTVHSIPDFSAMTAEIYSSSLGVVFWLSFVLMIVSFIAVWRFVPAVEPCPADKSVAK